MRKLYFDGRFMPMFEADGKGGAGNEPQEQPKEDPKETAPKAEKKYSDEDLDAIIAKKFAKWKADEEKKVKEAEKLAGMSAAEKAAHKMEEALKRAEEAEAKLTHMNMTKEARNILSEKNIDLSDELLEYLVGEDAETTKDNIDDFAKVFNESVEKEVKRRLAGKTPRSKGGKTTMTKDEIMAIKDPVARRKAIAENMSLYE